jgi:hypothetical protein
MLTDDAAEQAELDGIVLEESTDSDEGSADLELDQFQATEIREIFLTTLPEYIEPVRQMVDQFFSPAGGRAEIRDALDATLASIHTAAARVGIDDVAAVVHRIRAQILELGEESAPEDAQQRITLGLEEIEKIASSIASQESAATRSETIVAAVTRIGGIDAGVLQKLTAAGLVTVDQIRIADPREIVAVTGLDATVVGELVRLLAEAAPEGRSSPPMPPARAVSLETKLEQKLRAQVELEMGNEELRTTALRLRTDIDALRRELDLVLARRDALRTSVADERDRVAHGLAALGRLKASQLELRRQQEARLTALDQAVTRTATLERERDAARQENERVARDITLVARRVDGLLQSAHARSGDGES